MYLKKITNGLLVTLLLFGTQVSAQKNDPREAFQSYKSIDAVNIVVPTVVSVPMEGNLYSSDTYLVREKETGVLIGSLFQKEYTQEEISYSASTYPAVPNGRNLVDNNTQTYVQFEVSDVGQNTVRILLTSASPQAVSKLYTQLSPHVSLPLTVAIRAGVTGTLNTVVATKRMTSNTITFPETTANQWEITFTYAQPLRIAQMALEGRAPQKTVSQNLRFLARPDTQYDIYFSSDRSVRANVTETGYLADDEGVLLLENFPTLSNPYYTPADVDEDGVRDVVDNCVQVKNTEQEDIDNNGRGDACDDFDKDGRINSIDNCPNEPNRRQADEDGDGIGDVCDTEESRFTEKNPWVPWAGMGVAVAVLAALFTLVAIGTRKEDESLAEEGTESDPERKESI